MNNQKIIIATLIIFLVCYSCYHLKRQQDQIEQYKEWLWEYLKPKETQTQETQTDNDYD